MKTVAVFSVPRSGSTWLGSILNSSPEVLYRFQPNFAYSFPYSLSGDSDRSDINCFHDNLAKSDDPFVTGKVSISGKDNLQFKKQNPELLIWKEVHFLFLSKTLLENSTTKVIGLIRSPFATLASWISIPKEFDPNWDVLSQWRYAQNKNISQNHYFGYEKWKEATMLFLDLEQKYPDRFYLLQYNNLLTDTVREITNVLDFCGLPLSAQTNEFLEMSSKQNDADAYSVFRTKADDNQWVNNLPKEIVKAISNDPDFIKLNAIFKWV